MCFARRATGTSTWTCCATNGKTPALACRPIVPAGPRAICAIFQRALPPHRTPCGWVSVVRRGGPLRRFEIYSTLNSGKARAVAEVPARGVEGHARADASRGIEAWAAVEAMDFRQGTRRFRAESYFGPAHPEGRRRLVISSAGCSQAVNASRWCSGLLSIVTPYSPN